MIKYHCFDFNNRERREREKLEQERAERERIDREKLELKERAERERRERERLERERVERNRILKESVDSHAAVDQHFSESLRLASQRVSCGYRSCFIDAMSFKFVILA